MQCSVKINNVAYKHAVKIITQQELASNQQEIENNKLCKLLAGVQLAEVRAEVYALLKADAYKNQQWWASQLRPACTNVG